ncbi:phosphonate C-P lyase system protein PhnG [Roseomonas elaeocarpi]|uniref:Phosphonate C-P lyase system protein PhnG n=1 Tax=Roseomonas elaeocarpi TaxID=907779 RepID=A0ABV6JRI9_9PROT
MSSGTREAEPAPEDRQSVMALCAEALAEELHDALRAVGYRGPVRDLRRPETGLVMVRGRAGGDGRRFNLGEATVTRAAVTLEEVGTGFAYHLGRDAARARLAATLDALWQSPQHQAAVVSALAPVRRRLSEERARAARQAAATRVDFFTMVRGEDA